MSKGINKFIGIGTVGKDPESKFLPSGGAVTNISIAVNESWKDKDGKKQEKTEWLRIVFFNRLAEIVNEYVKKGSKIYVEGSLRTRQWEQDGQTKYATEIVASEMQLLDSRNGGPAAVQHDAPARPPQASKQQPRQAPAFDDFDDAPF